MTMLHEQFDLIVFDADGTLRYTKDAPERPPNTVDEQALIDRAVESLRRIDWSATQFGIASNQGGVEAGHMSREQARSLLQSMVEDVRKAVDVGEPIIELCPHSPPSQCRCRKPQPGMLRTLIEQASTTPSRTLFVGDRESDREAAFRADCSFLRAGAFHSFSIDTVEQRTGNEQTALFELNDGRETQS